MGKNKKPSIPSRPTPSTALPVQKVVVTAQQTTSLLGKEPPDWDAETVKRLLQAMPEPQKAQLAVFMEQFADWGSLLQSRAQSLAEEQASLEKKQATAQAEIAQRREALTKEDARIAELRKQTEQLAQQAKKQQEESARQYQGLIERETNVSLREAELRNGFVLEREASLKTLRGQVADLEARRNSVAQDIEEQRQTLLKEAASEAARIRDEAQAMADDLRQREVALQQRLTEQSRREESFKSAEALLKANRQSVAEHVQDGIKHEREQMSGELEKLKTRLAAKSADVDRLQQELDELEDLRDAGGDNPSQLLEELAELRHDNRAKDRELAELRSRAERDDPTELRQQRDHLQQQLDVVQAEVAGLRAREGDWQRSVTEKQDWEKTRLIMEKGRTLLHSETERLRLQVDDLMSRQQAAAVFPALKAMDDDQDLQIRAHTDVVPKLADLVTDLQARLYWATPGKPLFFQPDVLQLFLGGLAMSQLHVFQGISGTGKTSLATAFAKAVGAKITTVAVQAGWRDRADLLGYYNAFEKRFYERSTLQALYRAQTEAEKDKLHIVLLDEMNLSRPEQYFADFLSALEMEDAHRWINLMDSVGGNEMPKLLRGGRDIGVPKNVWFIGTANQDETTHGFADKTHDRAFVLDLPRWEGNQNKPKYPQEVTWSFESLTKQFDDTCRQYRPQMENLLEFINESQLTQTLAEDFQLGWGNRLERQLKRFVPVVIEAGGSESLAVDQLLQSRMFRDGKVVGRHDVQVSDLQRIQEQLLAMWEECELNKDGQQPTRCLNALGRDIKRLERGG